MSNVDSDRSHEPPKGKAAKDAKEAQEVPSFFDRTTDGTWGKDAEAQAKAEREGKDGGPVITPQLSPGVGGALGGTVNLQPTYKNYQGVAYPGMPASMVTWDADSYIVDKAAVAAIPFGVAVSVKGVSLTDGSQRSIIVGGTAANCVGITLRDITQMPSYVYQGDGYPAGWNAAVLTRGDIWVSAGSAIAVTDAVKFVTATGVFSSAGTITLANCRWMRGASGAGELALLRVNLPSTV